MTGESTSPEALARKIADVVVSLPAAPNRQLVAMAGPPGAGKSTVATHALKELVQRGLSAGLVSMDGFHYDNAILAARDLMGRKGAPDTFDVAGFHAMLRRLLSEGDVAVPEFDRDLDKAIAARSIITRDQRIVLVEGNYLFLNAPGWSDLQKLWATRVFLDVDLETLEQRLTRRWVRHGLTPKAAKARALANDIPNARRVLLNSLAADVTLR